MTLNSSTTLPLPFPGRAAASSWRRRKRHHTTHTTWLLLRAMKVWAVWTVDSVALVKKRDTGSNWSSVRVSLDVVIFIAWLRTSCRDANGGFGRGWALWEGEVTVEEMFVVLVVGWAAGAVVMAVELSIFSMTSNIRLIVELRVVDMMTGFTSLALLLNKCLVLGGCVPPANCPSCFRFRCWVLPGLLLVWENAKPEPIDKSHGWVE